MAAGASSPEMFAAFISLFVTHSSLGIGTIIGSEIFNHLCICAGSILYSKTGELELDARLLVRDVTFYALAIGALLFVEILDTQDKHGPDYDDAVGEDKKIYIHWSRAETKGFNGNAETCFHLKAHLIFMEKEKRHCFHYILLHSILNFPLVPGGKPCS